MTDFDNNYEMQDNNDNLLQEFGLYIDEGFIGIGVEVD